MSNEDIKKAIEEIFDDNFISFHQGGNPNSIEFEEKDAKGKAKCKFKFKKDVIRVTAKKDTKPTISVLRNKKCADGAFIILHNDKISLHILEMKSQLTDEVFEKLLKQVEGMYFYLKAIIGLLDLPKPQDVKIYVSYTEDAVPEIPQPDSRTLIKNKVCVGEAPIEFQWRKGKVTLYGGETAHIIKGQRNAKGDCDFGTIN